MLSEGFNRLGYSCIAIVAKNLGLIQLVLLLISFVIKALQYIYNYAVTHNSISLP